ncbi:MAG: chemotaxis response regulator protein-glutamate methylesterase [Thermodesulfobacteriota bacterium]|nr:chemotaxis response regulator protein-glutamate methylesterase [Thermodesulfobacteriota bacterium]
MKKIRVFIIDDSALVRKILKEIMDKDPLIEVIGTAPDPIIAIRKIRALLPDVLTLDIEMPKMDGLTFLAKLMKAHPMPVVMFSSLTRQGADATMKALALGAIDFIAKPKISLTEAMDELENQVITKVKAASTARVKKATAPTLSVPEKYTTDIIIQPEKRRLTQKGEKIVTIGASTGGTVALEQILNRLPEDSPPILIVQHMPPVFTKSFADRVNTLSRMHVREAKDKDRVERGTALIAPGGRHMLINRDSNGYHVDIKDGPPVNRHKPSVDVLFRSAANTLGPNAKGIILTGMGDDGARGLREMRQQGALTAAQDEESSVVFGMPKVAISMNGADQVLPLDDIPKLIITKLSQDKKNEPL